LQAILTADPVLCKNFLGCRRTIHHHLSGLSCAATSATGWTVGGCVLPRVFRNRL